MPLLLLLTVAAGGGAAPLLATSAPTTMKELARRSHLLRVISPARWLHGVPGEQRLEHQHQQVPVNKRSAEWVKNIGRSDLLHPDFGPSFGAQSVPYGIPITVVSGSHPKVHVKFAYSSESDHVRYPLGKDTKIEGGKNASGDRHAIVVDKATCRDYETWDTRDTSKGWTAGSGAVWSLNSNKLRYKPGLDLGRTG